MMMLEGKDSDLRKDDEPVTEEVVHGGEDDPLGGGVADLEDSDEATEGRPKQD